MHGVPVVAVGDLPAGRMFPVTVTLKDFGGRVGVQWEVVTVHVREGQIAGTRSVGHVTLVHMRNVGYGCYNFAVRRG
jgi:hypothetical protein